MKENEEITYCIGDNHGTPIYCKLWNAKNFLIAGNTGYTDSAWCNLISSLAILNKDIKIYNTCLLPRGPHGEGEFDDEIYNSVIDIEGTVAERQRYIDNLVAERNKMETDELRHIFIILEWPFEVEMDSKQLCDGIKKADPLCHFILNSTRIMMHTSELISSFDVKILLGSRDKDFYLNFVYLSADELDYLSVKNNMLLISHGRKPLKLHAFNRWEFDSYSDYKNFILIGKPKR